LLFVVFLFLGVFSQGEFKGTRHCVSIGDRRSQKFDRNMGVLVRFLFSPLDFCCVFRL
jgi:hypothetical protein